MSYVDGFLAAVPTAKREAFRHHAETMAQIFKEFGALNVSECWGDDVPEGKLTSFPLAVKLQEGETVVFSWILWPDRSTRDAGMASFMADPRVHAQGNQMPFDGQRMVFGGFQRIVDV